MISFYTKCKHRCDPLVKPLGFQSYERFYYRAVDHVMQRFCFVKVRYYYNICFDMVPLCMDNIRRDEEPQNQVSSFCIDEPLGVENIRLLETAYGPDYWVEQLYVQLEKLLLPWFNTVQTTEEAYQQVEMWHKSHKDRGTEKDKQMPETMRYGYLLQMGRYAEALALVNAHLALESAQDGGDLSKWQQRQSFLMSSPEKIRHEVNEQSCIALKRFKWKPQKNQIK